MPLNYNNTLTYYTMLSLPDYNGVSSHNPPEAATGLIRLLKDGQHRCTGTVRPHHLELKIEVIGTTAPEGYQLKALKICARAYVKMYVEDETQDKDDELTWYGSGDYHFVDCGAWGEVANCITKYQS
jgi:hypothetical protein